MNIEEEYSEELSPLEYRREFGKIEIELDKVNKNHANKKQTIKRMETDETIKSYLDLLQDEKVKKYIEKKEELRDIEYILNELKETKKYLYQKLCNHPAILVVKEKNVNGKIINSGICLECFREFSELHQEHIDPSAILYYKERTDSYFLTHEEIMEAINSFKEVKKDKRCSDKKAIKVLNRRRR